MIETSWLFFVGDHCEYVETKEDILDILDQYAKKHITKLTLEECKEKIARKEFSWKDYECYQGGSNVGCFVITLDNQWELWLRDESLLSGDEEVSYDSVSEIPNMQLWNTKKRYIDVKNDDLEAFIKESRELEGSDD